VPETEGKLVQLDKIRGKELEQLFEAILELKTMEDCYLFFDDLCTVNEMKSMAQRLEVARMLRDKQTYSQIEEETGASTATISRVKRCLNYGNGGYMMALERLKDKEAEESSR
jgi:TrpR-related protein YerC/YecD